MKKSFILLLIVFNLLSFNCWSKGPLEYHQNDETDSEEKIVQKKEIHLNDDSLLKERDPNTMLISSKKYTGEDKQHFNFLTHVNDSLNYPKELLGAEFNFGHHFKYLWMELFFNRVDADFDEMTQNRSNGPNPEAPASEQNFIRPGESKVTLYSIGLGVGYRFKLKLGRHFRPERIFQTTNAYAVYNEFHENFRDLRYFGPGFRVDYGLHHRIFQRFFYGLRFSYNLGFVKRRGLLITDDQSHRTLTLSYSTFSFDLGYYF